MVHATYYLPIPCPFLDGKDAAQYVRVNSWYASIHSVIPSYINISNILLFLICRSTGWVVSRSKYCILPSPLPASVFQQAPSQKLQQSHFVTHIHLDHIPSRDRAVIRSDRATRLTVRLHFHRKPDQSWAHFWSCVYW